MRRTHLYQNIGGALILAAMFGMVFAHHFRHGVIIVIGLVLLGLGLILPTLPFKKPQPAQKRDPP